MHRALVTLAILCVLASCAGTVAAPLTPPDRDADGVLDDADRCVAEAEDRDQYEDEDGCPDPDDDRDGRLDVVDQCPQYAEDIDAYQDADGCPDADNDSDRILDAEDQCPCIPEVFNGYQDEDGCPDRGYVVLEERRLMILEKIYFARDRATIEERSRPVLVAIAQTIVANPILRVVEVSGHASIGERRPADLSQARAVAVRDALVALGVEPGHLTLASHGADVPVAAGRTRESLEANRRVEFDILESDEADDESSYPPMPGPVPNCPEPSP